MDKVFKRLISNQGQNKLWLYFEDVTKKDYFQSKIRELRKKYNVPKNGHRDEGDSCQYPPIGWKGNEIELLKDLEKVFDKYEIHFPDWYEVIEIYFFYNKIEKLLHLDSHNLCITTDLVEESDNSRRESISKENKYFPIIIKISPYATQRDITDYIKKMYPFISNLQQQYKNQKINIGKQRKRDDKIQKRNDFIYKNRDKLLKEISKLVGDNFDSSLDVDQGAIGKILSLERKKRN